jgi:hypothetical protein
MQLRPFLINHNLVTEEFPVAGVSSLEKATNGNTGNSLIGYSVARQMGVQEVSGIANVNGLDFGSIPEQEKDRIKEHHDVVILMLQDHIRPNTDRYRFQQGLDYTEIIRFLDRLALPVVMPSIGIQFHDMALPDFINQLDPHLIQFLRDIAERVPVIGVRGEITSDVLSRIGITNSRAIGCPSFFFNGEDGPGVFHRDALEQPAKKRDWNLTLTSDFFLPRRLRGQLIDKPLPLIMQSEFDVIGPTLFPNLPLVSHQALALKDKLRSQSVLAFTNPREWIGHFEQVDLVVESRLHGAIAAIQGGAHALIVSDDMRTKEMSDFLGLPRVKRLPLRGIRRVSSLYEENFLLDTNMEIAKKKYFGLLSNYAQFMSDSGVTLNASKSFSHPSNVSRLSQFTKNSDSEQSVLTHHTRDLNLIEQFSGLLSRLRRRAMFL